MAWPRLAWPVLLPLLLADAVFLVMHLLHKAANVLFLDSAFNITTEWGHPEKFQYLKELGIAIVLTLLGWRHRSATFLVWALLFAYITLDDSLSIHERGGAGLAHLLQLAPAWGLRAIDLGELIVAAIAGAVVLIVFVALMLRGRPGLRRLSSDLLLLLALLAACGVGIDMLHVIARDHGIPGLGIAEDGGEMLVMSLIAACVAQHARSSAAGSPTPA